MNRLFILAAFLFSLGAISVSAKNDSHKHDEKSKQEKSHDHDGAGHNEEKHAEHDDGESHEHEESGEHADHDEHGEHEEGAQVGPNKGILEASESEGIKLSPEAEKNFELSRIKVSGNTVEIPKIAVVTAVAEVNVFRYRNGFYKRIDFAQVGRSSASVTIQSKDLKPGDEIVIQGLGFLRLAEIAAFGGAPEGHSH